MVNKEVEKKAMQEGDQVGSGGAMVRLGGWGRAWGVLGEFKRTEEPLQERTAASGAAEGPSMSAVRWTTLPFSIYLLKCSIDCLLKD